MLTTRRPWISILRRIHLREALPARPTALGTVRGREGGLRFALVIGGACFLAELAVMRLVLPPVFGIATNLEAAVLDGLLVGVFVAALAWFAFVSPLRGTACAEAERGRTVLAAIEAAAETVVVTDREGRIEYVNAAFERITGFPKEEALGRNPRILRSGVQDDAFYAAMWATIREGRVWSGRVTNRRRDGTVYEAEATIAPVLDQDGRPAKFVSVQRDVSRETELERNLHHAVRMEAAGRMAASVAHDLNNFLTLVLGNAELVDRQLGDGDPRHAKLEQIRAAGESAARLARGLVAFSRKDSGAKPPLRVDDAVRGMRPLLETCLGRGVGLRDDLDDGGDRVRIGMLPLQQVLLNLAVNARDAMPAGGAFSIRTGRAMRPSPGGGPGDPCVVLEIADTGTGMEEGVRDRAFEAYFTTKGPEKGTGLGLSTVRSIVEGAGGQIRVASAPGRGTAFTVLLPAA